MPEFATKCLRTARGALASAMVIWAAAIYPVAAEEMSKIPSARSDSLELPGLTAGCHICEWRPKIHQMPAGTECGTDKSGAIRVGVFECGYAEDCQRECHFLECAPAD